MTLTTRIVAAAASPVLAMALLGGAPAHADAPKITTSDFLTGAQVGKHFADLKKSKAEVSSIGTTVHTTTCDTQGMLRTKRDKVATYSTAKSKHIVQVSIFEMKSIADAKKVLAGNRRELSCGFVDVDGGGFFDKTKAPKAGNESIGQLIRWDGEEDEPARMAYYSSRTKNRVVTVLVVHATKTPQLAKARSLAKAAFTAAR